MQSLEGPIVDDRGVIRAVEVGVTNGDQALTMISELDFLPFRQEDIIDIGADLPCVQHLYPEDTFGGCLDGIVGADDRWRLAAKLERDWSEIARGIGHDCASRPSRTSKQQVVEGERGKSGSTTAAVAEELKLVGGEIVRRQPDQQGRKIVRVLRHLDHGAIACRRQAS